MRRFPAALCALGCAAVLWGGLLIRPQSAVPEGMNRTEYEALIRKYGLEPLRDVPFKHWLDDLLSGDFGCSWKLP